MELAWREKGCEVERPKGRSISAIARLNREFLNGAPASDEKIPSKSPGANEATVACGHQEAKIDSRIDRRTAIRTLMDYPQYFRLRPGDRLAAVRRLQEGLLLSTLLFFAGRGELGGEGNAGGIKERAIYD
jgi:hypothetical protein